MKKQKIILSLLLCAMAQGAWAWKGEGTSESPYLIETTDDLDKLAQGVNNPEGESINGYEGICFQLENDLTYTAVDAWDDAESTENNFVAIGIGDYAFQGTFDGQDHTISGIRIYAETGFHGLFGSAKNATIKNVIIGNARISGGQYIGGIVGDNAHSTVTNCHVKQDVFIHAIGICDHHGGIVGYNHDTNGIFGGNSEISYCSSAARLDLANDRSGFGGIVGTNDNSDVHHNLVLGAIVPASSDKNSGIIAGSNNNGTLAYNYYSACTFGSEKNATGKGCSKADVTEDDGAVPALRDNADNSTAIELLAARANVVGGCDLALDGRTLVKEDRSWNTLCLPFDVDISGSVLEGATVRALASSDYDNGKLTLTFAEPTTYIEAGKAYLIKWEEGGEDLTNPVFSNVTVADFSEMIAEETTDGYAEFIGCCSPVDLEAGNKSVLYLGGENTLYYPTEDMTIGAFRAYFELNGLTAGELADLAPIRLNFGEEETGIRLTEDGRRKMEDGWYTIDGCRIIGMPAAKGVYISGDKKVMIK